MIMQKKKKKKLRFVHVMSKHGHILYVVVMLYTRIYVNVGTIHVKRSRLPQLQKQRMQEIPEWEMCCHNLQWFNKIPCYQH